MRANHHNNLMFWVFFCFLNLLILPHVVVCLPEAPNTFGVNEDEEKLERPSLLVPFWLIIKNEFLYLISFRVFF